MTEAMATGGGPVARLTGEWMSPRRRFLSALYRGRIDRIPAATLSSVMTLELMDMSGAAFPEAHLDAELMARLAATAHDVLGLDTIMPVFHSQLEASALGADTWWGARDNWPTTRGPSVSEPDQIRLPNDFLERPAFAAVLGAIRLLRIRYPDVAIVGKVYGPWAIAYHVVGLENFLMDVALEPDRVRRYLDALLPAALLSARAQFEAGADAVMWADHTTGELCGPDVYRDYLLDVHRRVTREIGGPGIFHCCGRTIDRVHYFAEAGWDCFHFESQVDPYQARSIVGDRMSLMGNLNNPTLLFSGSYEDVYTACTDLLDAGVDGLAPEGSVPLVTRLAPLKAIADSTRDWSSAHRSDGRLLARD